MYEINKPWRANLLTMIKFLFYRINIPPLSSFNFFASLCFVVSCTGRRPRLDEFPKNSKNKRWALQGLLNYN